MWPGQVRRGGRLELVGIDVVDSTGSSAVFSEGQVTVTNCSFARCVTGTNNVMRSLEAAISSGGAALRALGGAIQARGIEAALLSTGSSFVACAAQGKGVTSQGGAINAAARVRIDTSHFEGNYVQGGTSEVCGGALYIEAHRMELVNSDLRLNEARGPTQSYGGAFYIRDCSLFVPLVDGQPEFCKGPLPTDCGVQVRSVVFENNAAFGGSSRCKGGALFIQNQRMCLNLTDSHFEANVARDSGGNTEGGAVQVYDKAILKISTTRFVRNRAQGATEQVRCLTPNVPTHPPLSSP
jgi:hypothetical protein